MNKGFIILLLIFISFFVSCSLENTNRHSVLSNNLNYITITNTTSDTLNLNISEIDKFLLSGSDQIDLVNPYDTVIFKIQIGLPRIIHLLLN